MARILIGMRCGCNRGSIIFQLFISEFPGQYQLYNDRHHGGDGLSQGGRAEEE
jgi:hypothetical protein